MSIIALIKKNLWISNIEYRTLITGRTLNVTIKSVNKKYNIINTYAPAAQKERLTFFAELKKQNRKYKKHNTRGRF